MPEFKPTFEEEMGHIVATVQILSPAVFLFAGERVDVEETASPAATSLAQNPPLVMRLQQHLYQHCYCNALGTRPAQPSPMAATGEDFLAQLSQANLSRSRWDANWQVTRVENTGQVWAEKAGVLRICQPGEFVNYSGAGTPVRVGNQITVYLFKESTTLQPGCYFAFGETAASSDSLDIFRFYWDINEIGVLQLLRGVSRDLNHFQVPFQFKSPVWPLGYMRRDAAVLYVRKRFYRLVRELAAAWLQECAAHLRNDVPLFTLALAPGLGLAEDPETGESFGMNRCRHLAEAIWNAHNQGLPVELRLEAVKEHFRRHGLDFRRPYLNPGSVDQYSLQAAA
jgi:hypothetical protein